MIFFLQEIVMSAAYLLHRVEENKWICSMLLHWENNNYEAEHKSLEILKLENHFNHICINYEGPILDVNR
jgi:hypothetical protein